ncbi:N-acyl homoserine lactonase family protein [Nocardioides aquiterrae]|uniref:N-acyl homoserine lactonase family protein n=1 Tax=Nocardioides aquiterrae TaxID=203799 RepID=A0ABN1U770_9ACTN
MTSLHLLDGGTLDVESSVVIPSTRYGTRLTVPVQMFLVGTTHGYVLVDTGNDPRVIDDPEGAWGQKLADSARPTMAGHHHLARQLQLLGLSPTDVKVVIYTHLHHDHAGGGRLFPDAVHVVQRTEHRWAMSPDPQAAGAYVASDLAEPRSWRLADGDWHVLPGISLVLTPGHTPGHQSVMVWEAPDLGNVILAGDAINSHENIDSNVPPGITTDAVAAGLSMRRLTALADATDAVIVTGHDMEQFRAMPKAPERLRRTDEWPASRRLPDPGPLRIGSS